MVLNEQQEQAVAMALSGQFCLVTGGAGTGKTSTISAIATALAEFGEVELCAFAGKAAARLREATGRSAGTIHRLLGYCGTGFRRESLAGLTVIVDEASMVSSTLMAEIVRRRPQRLILVGDEAQLPPVGEGQPFHDLLSRLPARTVRLTHCYRSSEAVHEAAQKIRAGHLPPKHQESPKESWKFVEVPNADQVQATILHWVECGQLDFDTDIILAPRNGEGDQTATVKSLNTAIKALLNPSSGKLASGDRVICTKNMSDLDIWNGTTGRVMSVDEDGSVLVGLDVPANGEDVVQLDKKQARELELGYALTIHKSQGSQYRRVVLVCLARDSFALLDRSLLYTGITRTQEGCAVIGQWQAFAQGIQRVNHKVTVLQHLESHEVAV